MKSVLALVLFAAVLLLVRGDFDTARTSDMTTIDHHHITITQLHTRNKEG
jgi:hypothetical protein